jgi:hypothetical protein
MVPRLALPFSVSLSPWTPPALDSTSCLRIDGVIDGVIDDSKQECA